MAENKQNTQSTEEILGKLGEVFNPTKKEKKNKKVLILEIDGNIATDKVSMKDAKKIAKRLSATDSIVKIYELKGTLSTNLDVTVS